MTIYDKRLATLKSYMEENNIQTAMIHDPENVFYYTGFLSNPHERFMGFFIDLAKDQTKFFVPALDRDAAEEATGLQGIVPISDEQLPFEVVKEHLPHVSGTLGLEDRSINYERIKLLQNTFPNIELANIQPFINDKRKQKSTEEIVLLKEALRIIEEVYAEGVKQIKVGMTESEVVGLLETLMRKFGADGPSFSTIVLAGEKSALPHGSPGERVLAEGDFLLIDFGVIKDGYCSDITRTFVMGEATERQQEIYDIVKRSNEAGIAAVKGGEPLKNFDIAARKVIDDAGYGEYFNNRVGHGLGIGLHEEPSVHMKNEEIAKPGYVFTIEPGIYIQGWGGVRIEDTVYIDENGECVVLSSYPKELASINN